MHRSPLNDIHESAGAKMIEFAGWSMPLRYRGIVEEHHHTRSKASLFDVSHMGRYRTEGDDATAFLDRICTRNLAKTQVNQSRYAHVCNELGGIIDDVIVGRHADHWTLVCNAGNREIIGRWLQQHAADFKVTITDETFETAMIAIQGPEAVAFVERTFSIELQPLKRFQFLDGHAMGMDYTIYRSGYTGEDGVEAVIPTEAVPMIVPLMVSASPDPNPVCKLAGLAARDTLRLEAAMPLYGHELNDQVDSLSAGQAWCVDLDKDFIGAEAMRKINSEGLRRKIVGLELEGKRIARQGHPIVHNGQPVGEITSGTMSPTLNKSIAMGLLDHKLTEPGTEVSIDLGRKENSAKVVPIPFYKRPKS